MKGVILLGGTGSRLFPLTKCINKHLLPVCGKPMAQWNLEKFAKAGITDVMIISGQEHCGSIISQFGDGSELGLNLTYKVQAKAGGIAQAIRLAKDFACSESICVILGDNMSNIDLSQYVCRRDDDQAATIFLKEVHDPERYGVAEGYKKLSMFNQMVVTNIVEKPKEPKTNYAVTGFYIFPPDVFDFIDTLKPSARGELEVTDLNMIYVKQNRMNAYILGKNDFWTDAGTFSSYQYANELFTNIDL
jgi:glucose-1-phosphate thymidylyltransferase